MYKCIVLAYDGTEAGQLALLESRELAQWSQAVVWLVAVMPSPANLAGYDGSIYIPEIAERDKQRFQSILEDGLRRMTASGYQAQGELLMGESVHQITEFARKVKANLIVVGHKHLESWAARWWRGSVSSALIEHAHCSVLCVITE
ncbi:universal stress protein [Rhodoferax lacus]|uniref:Universal stress protein n=1 Tax=Rhodoferax lacus TaxID=2184758 RepID=A0A3E1RHF2_9BURK|nr:universal stress protein [Rhodoferax lacus]RFO98815.1 universal stress protein [Rhodoferax lacus]